MIYGAATVEVDEDGYLIITSIEECDSVAISKELFIIMIDTINSGINAKKVLESIEDHIKFS
jgi:hypothetical protein